MKNEKVKIVGVVVGVLVLLIAGCLLKIQLLDRPTLVTVVGEGRIKIVPQMVKFTMTIINTSPTATQALADNNRIVKDLISVLKTNGVQESDISLSYVRVIPPQATLGQTSFQAINSADVTLKDISKFDNLVFQLYANGAQSLTNILFTVENSRELEKQAVAQAILDAKQRAKEMAKVSGKRLSRMISIATVEIGEAGALAGQAAKPTDLEGVITASPSQIEIVRQASVVFELR